MRRIDKNETQQAPEPEQVPMRRLTLTRRMPQKPEARVRMTPWGGYISNPPEGCPAFNKSFVDGGMRMLDIGICQRLCKTGIRSLEGYCGSVQAQIEADREARKAWEQKCRAAAVQEDVVNAAIT